MTTTQSLTKQLATYEAKVNDTEHRHRTALQEIDFCTKERTRLEVLLELGETTQSELDAIDERRARAARERDETAAQLELSGKAQGELQGRLATAKEADREAAQHAKLLEYRDTAAALLSHLEQVALHYNTLRELAPRGDVSGIGLEIVGKNGLLATTRWLDHVRRDLARIDQHLQQADA